jgi:fluoroquinolone transport system permease protein
MTRFLAAVRWDAALQRRNGFYAATLFVTLFWGAVLAQARGLDWERLLPLLLLGNLLIGTFYFVAGLVLLEQAEGSIQAQVVTPLRSGEYLASKTATLSALALAETLAIAVLVRGADFRPLPLLAGTALACALYCLAGFVAVVRYPSLNAFLLPSGLYAALLWLPLLASLAGWRPWPLLLHPLSAPLLLVEASVVEVPPWQQVAALLCGAAWVAALFVWSRRAFRIWLVERRGG